MLCVPLSTEGSGTSTGYTESLSSGLRPESGSLEGLASKQEARPDTSLSGSPKLKLGILGSLGHAPLTLTCHLCSLAPHPGAL